MKTYNRKYSALLFLASLLTGSTILACLPRIWAYNRQNTLNHQLLNALLLEDTRQAIALVEAGANPNTLTPLPVSSVADLMHQLFHTSPVLPVSSRKTAFLCACGCNWYEYDHTPQIQSGDPAMLQLTQVMLLHGANVNAKDENGRTLLMWVASNGRTDIMHALLQHAADISLQSNRGQSALHYAVDKEQMEAVKVLIKYSINKRSIVNITNSSGSTVMMHASARGLVNIMTLLLHNGASIDLQDNKGQTALHYAVVLERTEAVRVLLKHHAKLHLKNRNGKTPLDLALQAPHFPPEIIQLLKQAEK